MRKNIPVVLGILWLLLTVVCYGFFIWNGQPDGTFTYENDGCTQNQKVYVTDNDTKDGMLYEMDLYGKVSHFFSTKSMYDQAYIREVAGYQDKIYAVLAIPSSAELKGVYTYRILCFSDGLTVSAMTPELSLSQTDELCDLVVNDDAMYLATVAADGDAASIYEVDWDRLMDLETAKNSKAGLESFLRQEATGGRTYVDASYELGSLCVRTDADLVSGPFAIDDTVKYTYSLAHMSLRQLISLHSDWNRYLFTGILVGWLVIFLLYALFHNKNRIVYLALVLEFTLLLVIIGGGALLIATRQQANETAETKWVSNILGEVMEQAAVVSNGVPAGSEFYTSEEYDKLADLLQAAKNQTSSDGCVDLFLADMDEQNIFVSAGGHNNETITDRYFSNDASDIKSMLHAGKVSRMSFSLDGTDYELFASATEESVEKGYVLVGVFTADSWTLQDMQEEIIGSLILFALASLVCIAILLMQSSDLSRLSAAMQQVATGKTNVKRPEVYGGDMRVLWNALGEIQNQIRKVNYSKFLAFEAYYRFAPKNIERLLNKESITEVKSGDCVKLNGTMGLISTVGPKSGKSEEISRLTRLLALIGRCQEEKDGVLVSNDASLSMLRILFMENNKKTLTGAIEFLHELGEEDVRHVRGVPQTSVLLHNSSFVYGVAGTNQQSSPFLVSEETDEIERFAGWFREHGLRLVVSETVKERENYTGLLRCIGFIQMTGSKKQIRMYEVLDVLDIREREKKQLLGEHFEQALELFYQHDFYLARSAFSDILKELPTDEIAKWYLFTCETYLNMEHTDGLSCALRYEE